MLLTIREVARELRTNTTYVYRLINKGLLPVLKLGSYKVRRESLDEFLRMYEGHDLTDPDEVKRLKDGAV